MYRANASTNLRLLNMKTVDSTLAFSSSIPNSEIIRVDLTAVTATKMAITDLIYVASLAYDGTEYVYGFGEYSPASHPDRYFKMSTLTGVFSWSYKMGTGTLANAELSNVVLSTDNSMVYYINEYTDTTRFYQFINIQTSTGTIGTNRYKFDLPTCDLVTSMKYHNSKVYIALRCTITYMFVYDSATDSIGSIYKVANIQLVDFLSFSPV